MREGTGRLSYANVMATIAVFLTLAGGVAWALDRNSVKSKHIKNNAVTFKDLRGVKAWNKLVGVSAEAPNTGDAFDAADSVTLAKRGAITFFGQCVRNTATDTVFAGTFARTKAAGAIYRTGADQADVFNPGDPAAMPGFATAGNDTMDFAEAQFDNVAILTPGHALALSVVVHVGAKNGTPPGGNGAFGAGDRCSFSGSVTG